MRNVTIALTEAQVMQDRAMTFNLTANSRVKIAYTKRDGSSGLILDGSVVGFVGTPGMSTHAVRLDTERGPRTVNTYLIHTLTALVSK